MALLASMSAAAMAMVVTPRQADEMTEEERKMPLPEPAPEKPTNLPGESNRAFAARMKAASMKDGSDG